MKQIYAARNAMEAHFLQGLLAEEGIKSTIQGEALDKFWGDLHLTDKSLPSLWVEEVDVPRARPIVDEYDRRLQLRAENGEGSPRPTWKCPQCGELIEEQFTRCWHCNATKPV